MSAVEILREARALIADKSRWTQYAFARGSSGEKVGSYDRDATCWCAIGAFNKVTISLPDRISTPAFKLLRDTAVAMYGSDISKVNDGCRDVDLREDDPHSAVMNVYQAAIAKAEGRS